MHVVRVHANLVIAAAEVQLGEEQCALEFVGSSSTMGMGKRLRTMRAFSAL
jgi:hypothetical protein